jgi:hypothetical protein
MSEKELSRLRVLIDVADGKLAVAEAESLLSLRRRQVFRLLERLRTDETPLHLLRCYAGPQPFSECQL